MNLDSFRFLTIPAIGNRDGALERFRNLADTWAISLRRLEEKLIGGKFMRCVSSSSCRFECQSDTSCARGVGCLK